MSLSYVRHFGIWASEIAYGFLTWSISLGESAMNRRVRVDIDDLSPPKICLPTVSGSPMTEFRLARYRLVSSWRVRQALV